MSTDTWLIPRRSGGRGTPAIRGVRPFWSDLDQLLGEMWRGFDLEPAAVESASGFSPRVDVSETDDEFRITAELPGLDEKDFEVVLEGDVVTLKGEKREERKDEREGRYHVETTRGSFARSFRLPCDVDADAVKAVYEKGVLTVRLPKPEQAKERIRSIPISAS